MYTASFTESQLNSNLFFGCVSLLTLSDGPVLYFGTRDWSKRIDFTRPLPKSIHLIDFFRAIWIFVVPWLVFCSQSWGVWPGGSWQCRSKGAGVALLILLCFGKRKIFFLHWLQKEEKKLSIHYSGVPSWYLALPKSPINRKVHRCRHANSLPNIV